ncbi:hypothetical protein [Embleya sp. NBC_00896]|uniref:hypothetical protein n=1 Tax=Embleya sp. NBC_00896 TaxID=2975961 RepID=UPI0038676AF4|nr:hypothetical protein OG928_12230 [Embleya sp. NBC_00896]
MARIDRLRRKRPARDEAVVVGEWPAGDGGADHAAGLLAHLRAVVAAGGTDPGPVADRVAALPTSLIVRLDRAARPRAAVGVLAGLEPSRRLLRTRRHPLVAAVASLDENGGLREEAVVRLAAEPGPLAAVFLALRTDDWVDSVRERALAALLWHVEPDEVRAAVPVLHALRGRVRSKGVLDAYREALLGGRRRPTAGPDLGRDREPAVRRLGIELLDDAALLVIAARDPDHACRIAAGHALLGRLRGRDRHHVALRLMRVPDPRVRERAIELLPAGTEADVLVGALADRSPRVRDAARRRLLAGGTDPAAAYREFLRTYPSPGLLLGLAECGADEDLHILHAHLDAERSALRRAARAGAVHLVRRTAE